MNFMDKVHGESTLFVLYADNRYFLLPCRQEAGNHLISGMIATMIELINASSMPAAMVT